MGRHHQIDQQHANASQVGTEQYRGSGQHVGSPADRPAGSSAGPGREQVRVNSSGVEDLDQAVAPAGPPTQLGWRARRRARVDAAHAAQVQQQLAHAQRRARQVAAFGAVATPLPDPRTPLDTGRPPWTTDTPPTRYTRTPG